MREFELLSHVYRRNAALPGWVTIPPGDDMGALRLAGPDVLVTVDQVADGVHFDLGTASLQRVARKAITRNLSDVAAMAAVPAGAVVAASLPQGFTADQARTLFDAMRDVSAEHGCPLFGGDIAIWPGRLLLSVTVLATPLPGVAPIRRSGAQAGDVLYVSGELGGSLQDVAGHVHHLDFTPRLALAHALAADVATRPRCMIDLSDGLSRDAAHLADAADLGVQIDLHRLPVSAAARQAALQDGQPDWLHALSDGEDYELCWALSPAQAERLPAMVAGVKLTAVGRFVAGGGLSLRDASGCDVPLPRPAWEHQGKG